MSFEDDKPKKKSRKTFLEASEPQEVESRQLVAKRDFRIVHNAYDRHIKAGEDLSDVPEHYHPNLRTEGVL